MTQKTAISVPDDTFERVERRTRELGWSRSEFYSRAAAQLLDALNADNITAEIDAAIVATDQDGSDSQIRAAGLKRLADVDW